MNVFRSLSLTAIGGSLLLLAILRLRKYKLKERYTILFLLIGTPFLLLAVRPDTVGWLAVKLGLQYTTLALICVSAFLFLIVFELLSIVSVQDRKINALAQLVAILMEKQKLAEQTPRDIGPG